MSDDLKPCPWAESKPEVPHTLRLVTTGEHGPWWVLCSCGVMGPAGGSTQAKAVATWNAAPRPQRACAKCGSPEINWFGHCEACGHEWDEEEDGSWPQHEQPQAPVQNAPKALGQQP